MEKGEVEVVVEISHTAQPRQFESCTVRASYRLVAASQADAKAKREAMRKNLSDAVEHGLGVELEKAKKRNTR